MDHSIDLVATDLDGTLLRPDKTVSQADYETFENLGRKGIVRVAATGRSLHSVKNVLQPDFPFDYIVFSTGSGIYDWKNSKVLYSTVIPVRDVRFAVSALVHENLDFTIHHPIPENHRFIFKSNGTINNDFNRYCSHYKDFCLPWDGDFNSLGDAAQLLSIIPQDLDRFSTIQQVLTKFKVVRTTSPLDPSYLWMEIFHHSVSKANGLSILCNMLGISSTRTLSVGNDYNDLELLKFTRHSYVVENAPDDLRKQFSGTSSNLENGFSTAVRNVILS